jgi:hypothetical protein
LEAGMTTTTTAKSTIPQEYVREIDGRVLAHRGALEHLTGRSKQTVDRYFSTRSDCPKPVIARGPGRRAWYEPQHLVDFAAAVAHHEAGVDPEAATDPTRLLAPREAAEVIKVAFPGTFNKYIEASLPFWERGENGILPIPDEDEPYGTAGKRRRRWKTETLVAHQAARPGQGVGGGRPATGASKPS